MVKMLTSVIFFGAAVYATGGIAPARAQQASSFQKSCNDFKYVVDKEGKPGFTASCLRSDGRTRLVSGVPFGGFQNIEGRLSAKGGPNTFQNSCRNIRIEMVANQPQVVAECRKTSGDYVPTSTIIWDVRNEDGRLRYRVPGAELKM